MKNAPPIELFRQAFDYDSETGNFVRKPRGDLVSDSRFANKVVSSKNGAGYLMLSVTVNKKTYNVTAHRVAWAIHHGFWPKNHIDHADNCKTNNAISNLRDVTQAENNRNSPRKLGKSGARGVYLINGRWCCEAFINGKKRRFGAYDTVVEAAQALEVGCKEAFANGDDLGSRPVISRITKKILTIHQKFYYDPISGHLYRRARDGTPSTKPAGGVNIDGYRRIKFNGRSFLAHTLVWMYCHGAKPSEQVDHIDGNRDNNVLSNLRSVSRSVNSLNRVRIDSTTRGINRRKCGGWQARITIQGKRHHIGTFPTFDEAQQAWHEFVAEHAPGAILRHNVPATVGATITPNAHP